MARPRILDALAPPRNRAGFYGWRMVGVAFVVDFIAVGFFFYSYGVFLKEIAGGLSGGRFGASLGLQLANVVGAIAAPFIGRALDRLPIKRIMIAGAFCVAAGFLAMSRMTALWQLYLIMGTLLGFGMAMMANLASAKLVSNWFEEQRGKALGIATIGVSLSGFVMPAVATWLIATVGWRGGFQVYAALTVAVVVPLAASLVVNRPEDMGLRPDGGAPPRDPPPAGAPQELHWRTAELLGDRNFWAIALIFALAFSSLSAVLIHLVPYADDLGIASDRSWMILSAAAGAGALGKPSFGYLIDRIDARAAIWASLAGQLLGIGLFLHGGSFDSLLAAALVYGFSMGGVIPLQGAVTARIFGRLSFGKAMGLLRPVQIPIHMLGVPLAGWIFDTTGSYDLAFQIFAGFYVVGILCVGALRAGKGVRGAAPPSDGQAGVA